MMRRIHLFMIMCVLAAGSLQAQLWERIANPFGGPYSSVYTVAALDGWTIVAGGTTAVWRTRTPEQMGSMQRIDVVIDDSAALIDDIVEHKGRLFARSGTQLVVSDDIGTTWRAVPASKPIDCSRTTYWQDKILLATPTALTFWCESDGLWRSTDGGLTWVDLRPIPPSQPRPRIRDVAVGENLLAVVEFDWPSNLLELHVSTDDGLTWSRPTYPAAAQRPEAVSIGTRDVLYVHFGPRMYRSADQGATWTHISAFDDMIIGSVYAVKDVDITGHTIMRSDDAGMTWAPFQNSEPPLFGSAGVWSVSVSATHVYAVTSDLIFWTPIGRVSSVSGEQAAGSGEGFIRGSGERVIRGSVPWTRVRVERDTDVEVYNVLGERVDSYTLEPGEHLLDTPIPVLLIVKRKGE